MSTSVRCLELEDGAACAAAPVRYGKLRLLVRRRGHPLGYVDVANDERALERNPLASALARAFAGRLLPGVGPVEPAPATTDRPQVSAVVCTRDRAVGLGHCLEALAAQDYPRYEVIVVDNAPTTDATREVAARWGARYVLEPRPGLDRARNCGLSAARGELVAYTDDDARPDPGWLSGLVAGFTSPGVGAVTGLVAPAELETRAQVLFEDVYGGMGKGFRPRLHTRRGRRLTYVPHPYGSGCNMAYRRSALLALGGFHPALDVGTASGGGGDLDMLQRVIESDAAIAYRPDAIVFHLHRRTLRQLRRQLFDNGRGFGAMQIAALVRARGLDRLRVVYWSTRRFASWHVLRAVRRLLRREPLPLHMILLETAGLALAPLCFLVASLGARRRDRPGC